jgi:hypothetical protein
VYIPYNILWLVVAVVQAMVLTMAVVVVVVQAWS